MDERHEEMKGAQGWLLPSRRSLSWLIYLSEPKEWDLGTNGGALRTFPQRQTHHHQQGTTRPSARSTHDENLQIGWIHSDDDIDDTGSRAVYMDCFFIPPSLACGASSSTSGEGGELPYRDPHCILYCLDEHGQKEYMTRPWLTEALQGMPVPEFIQACAQQDATANDIDDPPSLLLFQTSRYARKFSLLEDRRAWDDGRRPRGSVVEDIAPVRGRLVVFDSVQLPHEVREIKSGTRRALAGWFHEKTQELQLP
jgi:hypothetical protein